MGESRKRVLEWRRCRLVRLHHLHSTLNDASLQWFHNAVLIGPGQHGGGPFHVNHFFFWRCLSPACPPRPASIGFPFSTFPAPDYPPPSFHVGLYVRPPFPWMREESHRERQRVSRCWRCGRAHCGRNDRLRAVSPPWNGREKVGERGAGICEPPTQCDAHALTQGASQRLGISARWNKSLSEPCFFLLPPPPHWKWKLLTAARPWIELETSAREQNCLCCIYRNQREQFTVT